MTRLRYLRYEILKLFLCRHTDGFETYEDFARHVRKHAHKVGITSDWRYLKRADSLFGEVAVKANHTGAPLGRLEECRRQRDLAVLRYNNPTNEIAIRHGSLIATCFSDTRTNLRPYFLRECLT